MGEILDDVARAVAAGGSRRDALKKIGGAVAGALLVSLGLGAKPVAANGACRACGSSGAPCCGCCSGTTGSSCAAGTSNSLCGIDGNRCVVCPSNTRCNGGACTCCPAGQPNCGFICAIGQPCTADGTCGACTNPAGGVPCNGVCKLLSGATCSSHAQCAGGICSTASPRTCIGVAPGGTCTCDAACAGGTCSGGTCLCGPGSCGGSCGTCSSVNAPTCTAGSCTCGGGPACPAGCFCVTTTEGVICRAHFEWVCNSLVCTSGSQCASGICLIGFAGGGIGCAVPGGRCAINVLGCNA